MARNNAVSNNFCVDFANDIEVSAIIVVDKFHFEHISWQGKHQSERDE